QKGRGYAPAENDPIKNMHDVGSIQAGSYAAVFSDTLVKLGELHPELVAITAAMPDSTGLLPFRERFGDRCIDVGIAEQHAVTAATGMAMGGLRPLIAVYATFLTRAVDQVNLDCGLHRQPVIFCLDRAGITGDDGPSHHGILDLVLLTKVPGMTVFAPSSLQELEQMMFDAMAITDGPVAIRWPKTAARSVPEHEVGSGLHARRVRAGDRSVCLIGVGKMLEACEGAADLLAADGIAATVWDPRVVTPLDPEMIAEAAAHRLVVSVEDGLRIGGAGANIRDALGEQNALCRMRVLGVPVAYVPHDSPDAILTRLGLDAAGVAGSVRDALDD
ncbi:MAG: transketolase C-terminal domain-containing protein, partial [Acidimicrobiales bacterium]